MKTSWTHRPKDSSPVLWIRVTTVAGEQLQGIVPNDLIRFQAMRDEGTLVMEMPPQIGEGKLTGGNTPRPVKLLEFSDLTNVEVLGVINTINEIHGPEKRAAGEKL